MPVATAGSVRAQRTEGLAPAGATMLLANTWHLAQRPGLEVVEKLGGMHRFMGWSGGLLTDSGGFQVFSLGENAEVSEEGVRLRHPTSGQRLGLTPESCIAAQRVLGSDVAMVLDHCVPSTVDEARARDAMDRTHRWAARCLAARGDDPMGLFAIVQGATHANLRRESADTLTQGTFDGFAIGGLAVGESKAEREDMTELVTERLPGDRPRYLMGVGTPLDLLEGVHRGVDLFDCILPTALAQRGRVYTRVGRLDLRRGVYRLADTPLDPACTCEVCARYSRAWLRHLFDAREPLAWTLLGLHNLHFWLDLMRRIRAALDAGSFLSLYAEERERLERPDEDAPPVAPKRGRTRGPPPTTLGHFALVERPGWEGAPPFRSIQDTRSGEVMHSVSAPEDEARRLYVDQPGLPALADGDGPELVVWDVGLGAGTNAMAVIRAWEAGKGTRLLHLVSFEIDLDALRLAAAHHDHFPALRHAGPAALLAGRAWTSRTRPIRWTLHLGDVLGTLAAAPAPDVILYDPFSFKADGPLWTLAAFARVKAACSKPAALYTYTNSTAARAAMLGAGFFVGPGVATGPKTETTVAWTQPGPGALFGSALLEKWRRSGARWPADVPESARAAFTQAIEQHPQWQPATRPAEAAAAAPPTSVVAREG